MRCMIRKNLKRPGGELGRTTNNMPDGVGDTDPPGANELSTPRNNGFTGKKRAALRLAGRKILFGFIFFLILITFGPMAAGLWVKHEIERHMKMPVTGTYVPLPLQPAFILRNVHFEWKNKVELLSGDLRVDYRPVSLLPGIPLRVRLSSAKIAARLAGDWARTEGVQDIILNRFEADLSFGRKGIREIYGVEASSPQFQFRIRNSEK